VIDRESDENDCLLLEMMMVRVKKRCGVRVADHSRDVVQGWIWLGWRTRDEK